MSRLKPRPTMIFGPQIFGPPRSRPAMTVWDRLLLLAAGAGAWQSWLLARGRLQIQYPYAAARRVIGAVVILEDCAPRFERAHYEGVALKITLGMVQHFVRMPVVGENRVAGVNPHDGVKAVKRSLVSNFTRRPALLSFADDVGFLQRRSGRRIGSVGAHTVSATVAAASAEPILTRFFTSVALIRASGS